jgi:hypothetical protein
MRSIGSLFAVLVLLLATAQPAYACDFAPPTLNDYTDDADIIAVGTLRKATADQIMLQSEQYLKGTGQPAELVLNNHHFEVGADCGLTPGAGGRFSETLRVIAFLKRDLIGGEASWRPSGIDASGIMLLADQQVRSIDGSRSFGSLDSVKAQIEARAGTAPAATQPAKPPPPSDRALDGSGRMPEKPTPATDAQPNWPGILLIALGLIVLLAIAIVVRGRRRRRDASAQQ